MKKILLLIFMINFLNACQSVTEGFTLKKNNNADEFLVEKKNPLVLPPEFDQLPEPKKTTKISKKEEEINLESIINNDSLKSKTTTGETLTGSLEESILEKIKSN